MATDIMGMFKDPNAIRQARIDDILKQYQATSQMGGSMNQLLGQVAAAGSNVGNLMAEGAAGMFGMTTPEEAKAAQLQDMASQLDLKTPQGLKLFSSMLANQGMTEEAMRVFELSKSMEDADIARKLQKEKLRDAEKGTFKPVTTGKKYNPTTGEYETEYLLYNERTSEFRNLDGSPYKGETPTASTSAPIDSATIAANVKKYQESLKKQGWEGLPENQTNPYSLD